MVLTTLSPGFSSSHESSLEIPSELLPTACLPSDFKSSQTDIEDEPPQFLVHRFAEETLMCIVEQSHERGGVAGKESSRYISV